MLHDNYLIYLNALADATNTAVTLDRCRYWPNARNVRIGPVTLDHHFMIYVEKGEINCQVIDKRIALRSGDLFWLPPGLPRSTWTTPEQAPTHYRVHFHLDTSIPCPDFADGYHILSKAWQFENSFRQLHQLVSSESPFRQHQIYAIILQMSARFLESVSESEEKKEGRLSALQQRNLDDFLSRNLGGQITPAQLAKVAGLSDDYFTRLFSQTYGISPRTAIKRERIQAAALLLQETDMHITEIAYQLGYANPYLLSRQFREEMNCTPSQFRRRSG